MKPYSLDPQANRVILEIDGQAGELPARRAGDASGGEMARSGRPRPNKLRTQGDQRRELAVAGGSLGSETAARRGGDARDRTGPDPRDLQGRRPPRDFRHALGYGAQSVHAIGLDQVQLSGVALMVSSVRGLRKDAGTGRLLPVQSCSRLRVGLGRLVASMLPGGARGDGPALERSLHVGAHLALHACAGLGGTGGDARRVHAIGRPRRSAVSTDASSTARWRKPRACVAFRCWPDVRAS